MLADFCRRWIVAVLDVRLKSQASLVRRHDAVAGTTLIESPQLT
jgi:hypothetical protein